MSIRQYLSFPTSAGTVKRSRLDQRRGAVVAAAVDPIVDAPADRSIECSDQLRNIVRPRIRYLAQYRKVVQPGGSFRRAVELER